MRVGGYSCLALLCLLFGTATFLLVAAPVDFMREQLIQQIKTRTGSDLAIGGPTSVSFLPRPAVTLSDISLSAPSASHDDPTLKAERLDVEFSLWSLLSRQIALNRLVLIRPAIDLRVNAEGRGSWDISDSKSSRDHPPPRTGDLSAAAEAAPASSPIASSFGKLNLGNLRVVDGTVRYSDERNGAAYEIKALDLELANEEPGEALQAKGSLVWRGQKVALEVKLAPMRALFERRSAKIAVKVAGPVIEASYEGGLSLTSEAAFDGKVRIKSPSMRELAAWLGKPIKAEAAPLDVAGPISFATGQLSLPELIASVGASSLSGSLNLSTNGRPHASGTLRLSELDLHTALVRGEGASDMAAAKQRSASAAVQQEQDHDSVKAPRDRGIGRRSREWSEDTIDLTPLTLVDADVTLVVDRLVYKELQTGGGRLKLEAKDGRARLTIEDLLLYEGRGRGALTFDGSGAVPSIGANLMLENVATMPLLRDALGFEGFTGRSRIALNIAGRGQSERQIIETLNGKVETLTTDGAIIGLDVSKVLRTLEQARLPSLEAAPADKTAFSEIAGTFTLRDGIAHNQDLRLTNQNVRITGSGTADLVRRTADYVVHAKVTESASGQNAVISLAGLDLPIRIEGPWEKLAFKAEFKDVLRNSGQATDTIKQIGRNLKSEDVQEALKGLLGGSAGQQRVKPRELLEKLLKKPDKDP